MTHNTKTVFKKIWAGLIILFFLVPLLLAFYLLSKDTIIKVRSERTQDGKILITVQRENVKFPVSQEIIARIFQVPLKLTRYEICFKNNSSIMESEERVSLDVTAFLEGINGENLGIGPFTISGGGRECREIDADKAILGGSYSYRLRKLPTLVKFDLNVEVEEVAYLGKEDKLIIAIISTIAFYAFLILLKEVALIIFSEFKIIFDK